MPQIEIFIDAECKPPNLPTPEVIAKQCSVHGPAQRTATNISGVRLPLDDGKYYWVKYGPGITMDEARTQDYVAQALERDGTRTVKAPAVYLAFQYGRWPYIVMEYINGRICDSTDVDRIAAAVQSLIEIKPPDSLTAPGPVGGGIIQHRFFVDRTASRQYKSVQQLEIHINNILRVTERRGRVRLQPEMARYGLRLCPADIHQGNFMKSDDGDGRIVALDFATTCFLPPAFFAFVLRLADNSFTFNIAAQLKPPESTEANIDALISASFALVPFGTNELGIPRSRKLKSHTLLDPIKSSLLATTHPTDAPL